MLIINKAYERVVQDALIHSAEHIEQLSKSEHRVHYANGCVEYVGETVIKVTGDVGYSPEISRQATLISNVNKSVLIIGAGGVGFWVCSTLCLVSPSIRCTVFDGDTLEETNRERIPVHEANDGDTKTYVLSRYLNITKRRIIAIPHFFEVEFFDFIEKPDIVIDCTDKIDIQRAVYNYCKENDIKFYKVGTVDNRVMVSNSVPQFSSGLPDPVGVCGRGVPQWAGTQMVGAANVVSLILRDEPIEIEFLL